MIADVINMPISFYDIDGNSIPLSEDSRVRYAEYCVERRRDPEFCQACMDCDFKHVSIVQETRDTVIYCCHAGLYECMVPIFDPAGRMLGSVVVGQQRLKDTAPPPDIPEHYRELFEDTGITTRDQLEKIGALLKSLSEYILSRKMLLYSHQNWAETVDGFLRENCHRNVSLEETAAVAGCSPSFITHNFRSEFNMTFKAYQRKIRMEYAMKTLKEERSVKITAYKLSFPDQYVFSKAFKAYWKKPPSAFLRQNNCF